MSILIQTSILGLFKKDSQTQKSAAIASYPNQSFLSYKKVRIVLRLWRTYYEPMTDLCISYMIRVQQCAQNIVIIIFFFLLLIIIYYLWLKIFSSDFEYWKTNTNLLVIMIWRNNLKYVWQINHDQKYCNAMW